MLDNTTERLLDVFFYGLYMDPAILKVKAVQPRNPRPACVQDYKLRVGKMATLLRAKGQNAWGMVYALTHGEIDKLYRDSGLDCYKAEALVATIEGSPLPVLCCNLLTPPEDHEDNPEYSKKLSEAMERLSLPVS